MCPIDDGYTPNQPSQVDHKHRVIPLHEVGDRERAQIERAMNDHPAGRGVFAIHQTGETGLIKKGGDYYCADPAPARDFMVSAQRNADITRKMQLIHWHKSTEPCDEHDHTEVEPEDPRSTAVGGRQHARFNG